MKKIYFLLFLSLISVGLTAQTVSILGNLGTSGNIVIGASNYHVSESIYTENEVGAGNFLSAPTAIESINFFINLEGVPTTVPNFKIYLKNVPLATTTFATGAYSTAGYTLVVGNLVTHPNNVGISGTPPN